MDELTAFIERHALHMTAQRLQSRGDSPLANAMSHNHEPQHPDGADHGWPDGASHWYVRLYRGDVGPDSYFIDCTYSMGAAHQGEPTLADVLTALALDASSRDSDDYDEFCAMMGRTTDSIYASGVWEFLAMQSIRLREGLGGAALMELMEAAREA